MNKENEEQEEEEAGCTLDIFGCLIVLTLLPAIIYLWVDLIHTLFERDKD